MSETSISKATVSGEAGEAGVGAGDDGSNQQRENGSVQVPDPQAHNAEARRQFLDTTASSLTLARFYEAYEFKKTVDRMGNAVDKLHDIRVAIDQVSALHASLELSVDEEIPSALALMKTYGFASDAAPTTSFTQGLEAVVGMFMAGETN